MIALSLQTRFYQHVSRQWGFQCVRNKAPNHAAVMLKFQMLSLYEENPHPVHLAWFRVCTKTLDFHPFYTTKLGDFSRLEITNVCVFLHSPVVILKFLFFF